MLIPLMILALYHLNFTSVLGKPNKSSGQIPLAIINTRLITVDVDTRNWCTLRILVQLFNGTAHFSSSKMLHSYFAAYPCAKHLWNLFVTRPVSPRYVIQQCPAPAYSDERSVLQRLRMRKVLPKAIRSQCLSHHVTHSFASAVRYHRNVVEP